MAHVVVGIFPYTAACLRLIGMLLVEKNEDWLTDDKAYLALDDAPWLNYFVVSNWSEWPSKLDFLNR